MELRALAGYNHSLCLFIIHRIIHRFIIILAGISQRCYLMSGVTEWSDQAGIAG